MESLTHLRAAVIQQHGSIGVDLQQGAGLIEVGRGERDTEFHRSQCESTFDDGIARIPLRDGCPAIAIRALGLQLIYDVMNDVVFDRLPVVRYISMCYAVEVRATYIEWVEIQGACDVIENALNDHHTLWTAEASKRGVGYRVRLAAMRDDLDVFEKVGVIEMRERSVIHRTGQVH